MKYIFTAVLIIAFFTSKTQAIINDTKDLYPLYASRDTFKLVPIQLKFTLKKSDNLPVDVSLAFDNVNLSFHCSIIEPKITLPKVTEDDEYETIIHLKVGRAAYFMEGDEIGRIRLASDDKSEHAVIIRFSNRKGFNANNPFWMEIGSNFDLIDGLQPNNFFSGIFLHKKDIRTFSFRGRKQQPKNKAKNLGIFAGVYESKTISNTSNDSFSSKTFYSKESLKVTNATNPNKVKPGEFGVFKDSVRSETTQEVRNLGLFLSPQVRLTNGSANLDGLHIFASLWLELQWQRLQMVRSYRSINRMDTLSKPQSQLGQLEFLEGSEFSKKIDNKVDLKSHYYGLGFPLIVKSGTTNAFIHPVIGISNQPQVSTNTPEDNLNSLTDTRPWKGFYAFQFRLNEEKYGFAVTGEVRGLLIKDSPPFVSLALTKKFDITKFLEFL